MIAQIDSEVDVIGSVLQEGLALRVNLPSAESNLFNAHTTWQPRRQKRISHSNPPVSDLPGEAPHVPVVDGSEERRFTDQTTDNRNIHTISAPHGGHVETDDELTNGFQLDAFMTHFAKVNFA